MKFLVLALCVCAASAASFGQYRPTIGNAKVGSVAAAAVKVAASPFVAAANVVTSPVAAAKYSPVPSSVNVAKTANSDAEAEVVSSVSEFNADGSYNQHVETNNGIYTESVGSLKKVGDTQILVVKGSYRYTAADGTPVVVTYIADENGFQPESESLPVGPPIPKDIEAALEYIARSALTAETKKY